MAKLAVYTDRLDRGEDIGGVELALILRQLASLEIEEGGPYAAFPARGRAEADLGLNLAIACFLRACDVELPKLNAFIDSALTAGTPTSSLMDPETLCGLIGRYRVPSVSAVVSDGLSYDDQEARVMEMIRALAARRFGTLSSDLAAAAHEVAERTIRGNPDKQMSLMTHYVRESLGRVGHAFDDEAIARHGLANICFWAAFVIYDDFWDEDEAAQPRLLPVANLFARIYIDHFTRLLPAASGFPDLFHEVMDGLDAANEWEMLACRMTRRGRVVELPAVLPAYGDFEIKFNPAAGHVLGPVALFVQLGYPVRSPQVRHLIDYFRHYLIAMQLNDDAHDWKEDLERGHISTAVSLLLARWRTVHPDRSSIDLDADMAELEQMFWFEVLEPLCASVLDHTQRSRTALQALDMLEDRAPLERFIERNERIARAALAEHKKSTAFLGAIDTQ